MTDVSFDAGMKTANAAAGETLFKRNMKLFASSKLSLLFSVLTVGFILMAVAAPLITPHDPNEADLFLRLLPPAWMDGGGLVIHSRHRSAGA